ncbi:MAG TPA: flagellar M-ring protein FliF, partial [Gammaproteobacteria bacterium]|nr:flagellar M-ring protein FliF [Gammaproteobacteria bacterium]
MATASVDADAQDVGNVPAADNIAQTPAMLGDEESLNNANEGSNKHIFLTRLRNLSRPRQLQLIMAMAATIAMIVVLYLWSSNPNYQLLYGKLSEEAAGEIVNVLKQEGIDYQLDISTGKLRVRAKDLHNTRLMLASQGLPKSDGSGYEMLENTQGFGSSQFMEKVRYHRAIEGELARSITGIDAVESARVHLAIPKQSVFVRDKREPSAAVMVSLKSGRRLEEGQVMSIVHMVAASVPDMKAEKVTVVDQRGLLLSKKELTGDMAMSTAQFDYRKKLEKYYVERIERILIPIVGLEGVRAQVDADIDFTVVEKTQESFNPDLPALRSEHTVREETNGGDPGSVPGALTNQPPGVANAPETLKEGNPRVLGPSRKSDQATYNYELDKTISHSKQ